MKVVVLCYRIVMGLTIKVELLNESFDITTSKTKVSYLIVGKIVCATSFSRGSERSVGVPVVSLKLVFFL